jgi:hypothetical protein
VKLSSDREDLEFRNTIFISWEEKDQLPYGHFNMHLDLFAFHMMMINERQKSSTDDGHSKMQSNPFATETKI